MKCSRCLSENDPKASFCNNCGLQFQPPCDAFTSRTKTFETPIEELGTGSSFAGRYQIIEELGKGGMGRVYKAFDKEINAKIAIKLIKPEVAGDQASIDRFRNELKLARDISHKNICRMYDLNRIGSTYFITMEYVRGEDLKKIMAKMGILSPGQAISIAKQVCEGLSEAHKLGIIHRDLKPSNIMIDDAGNVRIMDFGIARTLKAKGITDAGAIIGTPEYMSPEQIEAKAVDARSDIYSLGIVLYEMLTGQLPFMGDSPLSIGIKKKTEIPPSPKRLNPQLPDELDQLITRCLITQKDNRYQTTEELRSELAALEKRIPTSKRIISLARPKSSRGIASKSRIGRLIFAGILFTVVSLGLILVIYKHQKPALPVSLDSSQLTFYQNVYIPQISPDGQTLAFVRRNPYGDDLIVMDLATKQELGLLSAVSIRQLKWLPGGTELCLQGHGGSWRDGSWNGWFLISRFGGTLRPISAGPAHTQYRALAWAPDGSRYAGANGYGEVEIRDRASNLLMITPPKQRLSAVYDLDWSPEGDKLLIAGAGSLLLMDVDGQNLKELIKQDAQVFTARWGLSGDYILYLVNRGLTKEIWRASINRTKRKLDVAPYRVGGAFQGGTNFSIPKQSDKIIVTQEIPNWDLWYLHLDRSGGRSALTPNYLSSSSLPYMRPSISPDGKYVAFSRGDPKISNIYIIPRGSGQERQLTDLPNHCINPVWSPDSQQIAFISEREGAQHILAVSVTTGGIKELGTGRENGIISLHWLSQHGLLYAAKLDAAYKGLAFKGLYVAETGQPLDEKGTKFIYNKSNVHESYDFWHMLEAGRNDVFRIVGRAGTTFESEASFMFTNDLSSSADGHIIGGNAPNPADQEKSGFLVISLADMSKRFLDPGFRCIRIMADGQWVLGRRYDESADKMEYVRIHIADGTIEKLATLDYSIARIPLTKVADGEDEVLLINNVKSDCWLMDGYNPAIR